MTRAEKEKLGEPFEIKEFFKIQTHYFPELIQDKKTCWTIEIKVT